MPIYLNGISRKGLSVKILGVLLPLAAAVVIATMIGAGWVNFREQQDLLETRAQMTARLQAMALASPLWNLDDTQVNNLLLALASDPNYIASAIIGRDGKAQYFHVRNGGQSGDWDAAKLDKSEEAIIIRESIFLRNELGRHGSASVEQLGELELVFSGRSLKKSVRLQAQIAAAACLAMLLGVGLAAYVSLRRTVFRPLRRLMTAMEKTESKEWRLVDWKSSDEMGRVIGAYNHMVERLRHADESEAALREAEARYALAVAEKAQAEVAKMESLGQLVAGVAHEINTPIGTTLTAVTVLEEHIHGFQSQFDGGKLKKNDVSSFMGVAHETCALMISNINRAAELIQSFKQVAVDQTSSERRRFDLKNYLDDVLLSLRPRLKKTMHQVEIICPDGIEIDGYPGPLSQVVTNFVMNSLLHAYDEGDSGHITITVQDCSEHEIELVYRDDGKGIPESHLLKVFDPFFTTKRGAGGTGLGLHVVFNIVTQTMGGMLRVDSREGEGTAFICQFPKVCAGGFKDE